MAARLSVDALVSGVKSYALRNYDRSGWDVVVETMSDEEIAEVIGNARSYNGAIYRVGQHVRPFADYRSEIQSEAF